MTGYSEKKIHGEVGPGEKYWSQISSIESVDIFFPMAKVERVG